MLKNFILFFLISVPFTLLPQQGSKGVLEKRLKQAKDYKDSSLTIRKYLKENKNIDAQEAFKFLKSAEALLKNDSDKNLWADYHLDAGEIYLDFQEIDKAIESYMKSYNYYSSTQSPNIQLIESRFAYIYTNTGNYEQAGNYLMKLYRYALANNDKAGKARAEAGLGLLHYKEYMESDDSIKLRSSFDYSKKAYKWMDLHGDDLNKMKLNIAMADIISSINNGTESGDSAYYYYYQKAIKLADTSKTIPQKSKAFAYNQYARYLFDIGRPDLAAVNAEKAFELVKDMNSFEKLAVAKTLYKSYIENREFEKAATFFEKYTDLQDSLREFEKLANIQTLIYQQENPRKSSWIEDYWRWGLFFIVIVFAVVFILVKRIQKKKNSEAQDELKRLSQKLALLHSDINRYESEISHLKINSDENVSEKENQLKDILETPLLTDEQWLTFKKSFEKVNRNYSNDIAQNFSNVSQAELRYLYLKKLGMNHKEIAAVLGISPDSVHLYKHRLGKKVLPGKESILPVLFDNN